MNIQEATPIELTEQERSALEAMIRSPKTEHGIVERARIVLLAAAGRSTRSIADELATWPGRVSRWRTRFARERLGGLRDLPRPGPTPRYTVDTDKRILARLDQAPPAGYGRWTAPLLSRELVDVSDQYIWRFLREQKIDLAARKSWCQTDDPDFVAKAAEIVGLYLDPPQDAIVLAVDEKPHIQALERAQGYRQVAQWASAQRSQSRLQAQRHLDLVCCARRALRPSHGRPLQASPAHRVPRLHEWRYRGLSGQGNPRHPRQPFDPQAQARSLARPPPQRPLSLHPDL